MSKYYTFYIGQTSVCDTIAAGGCAFAEIQDSEIQRIVKK